jgi:peptidoglycan/xylan/chitin deacetylase (PgdA/CDA1 family)
LDESTLEHEIAGSRRALQRRFDVPVDFFCYPAGDYDERVIDAVEAAGFLGATTTEPGLATPDRPYELSRIRVDGSDGVKGLAAKLEAAIDEASA